MPEDTILKEVSHEKVQLPLVLKKINKNPNLEIAKTCHVKIASAYSPRPVAAAPAVPVAEELPAAPDAPPLRLPLRSLRDGWRADVVRKAWHRLLRAARC